ncbi:uncharacterized protein SPPG_04309 [Spizellomyces punctatus DAOM BR117]|uniref:Uncharacterized protein n=1 Tax=Spizellomyces punctatus (strain DAOM BR117) TaxID=645134 RepID=A0A0L0HJL2_SPIPD|nr:uncharacterized protein SPPG_04309 [Spizellomyces punctatus DAOM BR117]KND01218.1 hypothetical protein SPPG_04309 [Spizellomyces punctatus DAOM BR117]|eukprot:XP_016609257.1 hypothetical protein SPPG_04309 [Spizellomyces punctatus DAOM BR117]
MATADSFPRDLADHPAPPPPVPRRRALSISGTSRTPGKAAPPQGVYVGIEIEARGPRPAFCVYVHDGFYEVDFTTQFMESGSDGAFSEAPENEVAKIDEDDQNDLDKQNTKESGQAGTQQRRSPPPSSDSEAPQSIDGDHLRNMEDAIIIWLREYAKSHRYKIHAAGIGVAAGQDVCVGYGDMYLRNHDEDSDSGSLRLPARLWFELDILPIVVETKGFTLDERACSAARKAELALNPHIAGNIPRICCGYRHEVEVDANGRIHLADSIDYERTVTPETWDIFTKLVELTRDRYIQISFFNSTPQGGGVALMRHALLRLFRLMGVNVKWFVMKPKPEIFDITKRKFHNVLQGVAPKDVHLTDEDKKMFESWARDNVQRYWADGPIVQSDVIVIDDPQPCGIIPYIKRLNPSCKIIYRSHIEVTADLADNPSTEQHHVWSYLWKFIRHADVFISHPVANFVPSCVPKDRLVMMPASTDPIDGLNKELDSEAMYYYQAIFNRISLDTTGKMVDFANRPYVAQICRFDPSKGIPHLLKAYKLLRQRLRDNNVPIEDTPQLVVAGHGSIDDPDGNVVFEQVLEILGQEEYAWIADDIIAARLPPSDQLLNALLRGAHVALQLSTREGFEIKVTEALAKGVPVIAYKAGGIPHQIQHGRTGFLVEVGDIEQVVQHLYNLITDAKLHTRMSRAAADFVSEEYFTVFQAINWLWLLNAVHSGRFSNENPAPDTATIEKEKDRALHEAATGRNGKMMKSSDGDVDGLRCTSSPPPTDEQEEEDRRIEEAFEQQRQTLAGGGRWVKELWQREYPRAGKPRKKKSKRQDTEQ